MSILQEYESVKQMIGTEKYIHIIEFLKYHPEYDLSDVYYRKSVWDEMENWTTNK